MSTENIATKKRRSTSIPLIVGFLILGGVGYVFGEQIMTYVFYLQESMIAESKNKSADIAEAGVPQAPNASDSGVTSGSEVVPPGAPGIEGPGAGGPGAGGNMDPAELFVQRDKDSNGKLEGDEISERMRGRLSEVDTDQDSAVSKEEFMAAWQNRQSAGSGAQRPASDSPSATESPATESPATAAPVTEPPAASPPAASAPEPKL